jgi:hypothetical protein
MSGAKGVARDFKKYPRYAELWKRGFKKLWARCYGVPTKTGAVRAFEKFGTPEKHFEWWISGEAAKDTDTPDCQMMLW